MSKLSKFPLVIPDGANVAVGADGTVKVKGSLGELLMAGDDNVKVEVDGQKVQVSRNRNTKHAKSLEGTFARRIGNMATGVTQGFKRVLELHGTGFRATVKGNVLDMALGYSHPVSYELPDGVSAETPAQNQIVLSGIDKTKVGQAAAEIRMKRPPECYKGKGIRYEGEQIIMKETKKK